MNYIKHLTSFFDTIYSDPRLTPFHVSLYISLFQLWNLNRFENPFPINRSEAMKLSKIGSLNTYHKTMRELDTYGYIRYEPSHNPIKGSLVHMYNFDTTSDTTTGTSSGTLDANSIQPLHNSRLKTDTTTGTTLASLYKHNKHINNKTLEEENAQDQNSKNLKSEILKPETEIQETLEPESPKSEIANLKFEISKCIPPSLDQVLDFFAQENYPEIEARKFFNHFQSNGWKVGGKSPMVDWTAAAHNWMLNTGKFSTPAKPYSSNLNTPKNYGEPL